MSGSRPRISTSCSVVSWGVTVESANASGAGPTRTRLDVATSVRQRITTLVGVVRCRYGPRSREGTGVWALAVDAAEQWQNRRRADAARTYVAGTDPAPPEHTRVPLAETDFESEAEWREALSEHFGVVL